MFIYIFNLITIFFYSMINRLFSERYDGYVKYSIKKLFIYVITIQLILTLSLRSSSTGVDVPSYLNFFQMTIPNVTFEQFLNHRFEIGYKLLNKLISLFTLNEQFFLTVIAIMTIIPVSRFIYKHSKMPFLSFSLYIALNFYSFTFSGLRQGITYGIILISYDYIKTRDFKKFFLTVVIACLFHQSAIVFFPAYFLSQIRITKRNVSIIVCFNLMFYLFRRQIFTYFTSFMFENYEIIESLSINWMILGIMIFSYCLIFYKNAVSIDEKSNQLYMLVITGISMMIFATVGDNVMRMADYYYIFVILLIPETLNAITKRSTFVISGYLIIISVFVLHIWFLLYSDTYQIFPYNFFIRNMF